MNERYYLVVVKITSQGAEQRELTPYDDYDTCVRKFHEAFNVIGGGPKYIGATILDRGMNQRRVEIWQQAEEPEPNEE